MGLVFYDNKAGYPSSEAGAARKQFISHSTGCVCFTVALLSAGYQSSEAGAARRQLKIISHSTGCMYSLTTLFIYLSCS